MITVEIPGKDVYAELPEGWDELTVEQFGIIVKNWIKLTDQKISIDEFRIIVLYELLGMKRSPLQGFRDRRLSTEDIQERFHNLWHLCQTLNWIFEFDNSEGHPVISLSYKGVVNMIPVLETVQYELHGPGDGMFDISFSEYRYAWKYFESYIINRKNDDLDMLVAILYRPQREDYDRICLLPTFDGQRRETFNINLTAHYAEICRSIPYWQKYAIFHWFGNCDRFIKEDEIDLDGKMITFAPLFGARTYEPDGEFESNDLGLTGLLLALAESKVFGSMEQADKANYIDVLMALLYWKKQNDKLNRK